MTGLSRRLVFLITLLGSVLVCRADVVSLVGGAEITGTITRAVIGRTVDVLVPSADATGARLESLDWGRVTGVKLDEVARAPDTLVLAAGDRVSGTLIGSFFESGIQFITAKRVALAYDAEAVHEVLLGVRGLAGSPTPAAGAPEPGTRLVPASGLGVMIAYPGLGLSSDFIAPVTDDTLLLASLGVRVWLEASGLGFGVSSDVTYLLRFGTTYLGLGTGVLFDLGERSWHVSVNTRLVFPIAFHGKQAMLSLGLGFLL